MCDKYYLGAKSASMDKRALGSGLVIENIGGWVGPWVKKVSKSQKYPPILVRRESKSIPPPLQELHFMELRRI